MRFHPLFIYSSTILHRLLLFRNVAESTVNDASPPFASGGPFRMMFGDETLAHPVW